MTSFSQVNLKGNVFKTSDGKKEYLPFANVVILGKEGVGASTDFDGNFTISLEPGKYQLKVSELTVLSQTLDIDVQPGMKPLIIEMFNSSTMLKVTNVTARKPKPKTSEDLNKDVKKSEGVISKRGKEDIENQGGSNAKDAVKSITGISSGTSNNMIYIRGLGDRYNIAYLNGLPVPSPNTDLRMVNLGMFPTSIIEAVGVNKVLDASYYGDYAGGMINIETSKFFSTPTFNISISGGANTNTSFKDFRTYNGGKLDYLGIDNDKRQIPDNVIIQAKQNQSQYIPNGFYQSSEGSGDGFANNFNTKKLYNGINLIEEFSPLLMVDLKMKNSFSLRAAYNKDKALNLNFNKLGGFQLKLHKFCGFYD